MAGKGVQAMYKKLARIGLTSLGLFFALLLLLIYLAVIGFGYATENVEFVNGINAPAVIILSMAGVTLPAVDPMEMNVTGIAYGAGLVLVTGFVFGMVVAILYNIVALVTGGIKIKTNDIGYDY